LSGNALSISWDVAPNEPFGEIKIISATYENVDQATPVADSSSNTLAASATIQAGAVAIGEGDRLIYAAHLGNPGDHTAPGGYTELVELDGGVNDFSVAFTERDTTTVSATENPTATWSISQRQVMINAVLNLVTPTGFSATIDLLDRFYENNDTKVRVDYTLFESASANCNFNTATDQVQYSTNLGGPWTDATLYRDVSGLTSSPGGTVHNESTEPLYWDATGVADGDYYIQIKPHNGTIYADSYAQSATTAKVYTPTADDLMRHGKTFLDEVEEYFYFDGLQ